VLTRPSLNRGGIPEVTCIFLNKGFKKIPIVLRRGGGVGHALSIF